MHFLNPADPLVLATTALFEAQIVTADFIMVCALPVTRFLKASSVDRFELGVPSLPCVSGKYLDMRSSHRDRLDANR
jgi:hypothetical protein